MNGQTDYTRTHTSHESSRVPTNSSYNLPFVTHLILGNIVMAARALLAEIGYRLK